MPIAEVLARNAAQYGDEISLVEINPDKILIPLFETFCLPESF